MWGEVESPGLWVVRARRFEVFLCDKKSRSLPTEFVGEVVGELGGVMLRQGPLCLN